MPGDVRWFNCPRCNSRLPQSGEITTLQHLNPSTAGPAITQEVTLPVFQCDECCVPVVVGTSSIDAAYTFAVAPDGTVIGV